MREEGIGLATGIVNFRNGLHMSRVLSHIVRHDA